MAVDMLVDSGKLDACCAAEAAAIIAKGGGTAPLAYDFANNKGFADAIAAISSGGAEITDGIEILEYKNVNQYGIRMRVPAKAKLHSGGEIWRNALGNRTDTSDYSEWRYLDELEIVAHGSIRFIDSNAFARLTALTDITPLRNVEWINSSVFSYCTGLTGAIELPNLEQINDFGKSDPINYINRDGGVFSYCSGITSISVPKLKGIYRDFCIACTALKTVYAPACQVLGTQNNNRGAFYNCTSLESVQLGDVGCECNVMGGYSPFQGCTQSNLTIELYCTGANADAYIAKIRSGATNATIIIKASEATTYGGTSYAAGETMITSTP